SGHVLRCRGASRCTLANRRRWAKLAPVSATAHAAPVEAAASPSVDLDTARTAVRRAADDFARLVASAPDAGIPIPGSEWTVGDAAAHVALGTEAYVGYAHGTTEPWVDVSDIAGGSLARSNSGRLDVESARQ